MNEHDLATVENLTITEGTVRARVASSQPRPYDIILQYAQWNDAEWRTVLTILASEASYVAALLNDHLPTELEARFMDDNLSLDVTKKLVSSSCACKAPTMPQDQPTNTCEHIELVHHAMVESLKEYPLLLFKLMGMDEQRMLGQLRNIRSMSNTVSELHQNETNAGDQFKDYGATKQSVASLLTEENNPQFWSKEKALHTILRPVYTKVSDRANHILAGAQRGSKKRSE